MTIDEGRSDGILLCKRVAWTAGRLAALPGAKGSARHTGGAARPADGAMRRRTVDPGK